MPLKYDHADMDMGPFIPTQPNPSHKIFNPTQISLLGSLSLLVMIDELNGSGCDIDKFVDDTTITEIGHSSSTFRMHEYLDNLILWTQENDMKINISVVKQKNFSWTSGVFVISHAPNHHSLRGSAALL